MRLRWNSAIWHIPYPLRVMTTRTKKESTPQDVVSAPEAASVPRKGPLESLRLEDCSASIWARGRAVQGVERTFYSITFERSYVDKAGTRRYTGFFSPDDLGKLVSLCQQAEQKIRSLQQDAEAQRQDAA